MRTVRTAVPTFAILALAWLMLAGCGPTSFLITPVPADRSLHEYVVLRESAWPAAKVALIDVDGILTNRRPASFFGPPGQNPVSVFQEKLDRAANDGGVKAIILRIDSPGGGVTASDLMYEEVKRFKQRTNKPVIACMMDIAASGGYYLACAADRMLAQPTTVTGSIGVIMITPDLTGTLEKIGAGVNVIKSGEMKDAGSPFREMTPKDRQVFQTIIDKMYARFLAVVQAGRPNLPPDKIRQLADGRVYFAEQALEAGLIDEIGSLYDGIYAAKQAAGISDLAVSVVQYALPLAHRPNVYAEAEAEAAPPKTGPVSLPLPRWMTADSPSFLYLWTPGW